MLICYWYSDTPVPPAAWLWADGAHQSGKTVHLGKGNLSSQNHRCLAVNPLLGNAMGANPLVTQCHSGNSCNAVGAALYRLVVPLDLLTGRRGGIAAWTKDCPPNFLPGLRSSTGNGTEAIFIGVWTIAVPLLPPNQLGPAPPWLICSIECVEIRVST